MGYVQYLKLQCFCVGIAEFDLGSERVPPEAGFNPQVITTLQFSLVSPLLYIGNFFVE
jgi:hypothetical protein